MFRVFLRPCLGVAFGFFNIGCEICLFNMPRSFSDGITFLNLKTNADFYKSDHKPSFEVSLTVLNIDIISFQVYSTEHIE